MVNRKLVKDLLERTRRAEQAAGGKPPQYDIIRHDAERAEEIVHELPLRLKVAANEGNRSLMVMELKRGLHYNDLDNFKVEPILDVLGGGALHVAIFLANEGITLAIQEKHHDDERQGRSWDEVFLVAYW